jgi:L-lactate dehydrogenase complex protein LldE
MPFVQLFVTCLVDWLEPQVGEAAAAVLEKAGCEVAVAGGQTCCGQPAFNAGLHPAARRMAAHTLDVLDPTEGPIVVPSGSCGDMLTHHVPELMAGDDRYGPMAERVAARVRELTAYLVDDLRVTDLGATSSGRAVLHLSCHGLRNLGLRSQPRALLESVAQLELVAVEGSEECCGFGGLFAVELPEMSAAILEAKLDSIEAARPDQLIGGDVSCLLHMAGGLHRRGSAIQVRHIAEVLGG